jgi:adenine phosphoribosyltransferase
MTDFLNSLKRRIREVPDFPKPGILFRDITPLLADPAALALSIELIANRYRGHNIDLVIGAESRGFIFGTAVACAISAGFVPVRKPGKLPSTKVACDYDLEYGKDALEMHDDAIVRGQRVILIDDLLATGGTLKACAEMVEKLGGEIVGITVLIELLGLKGREKLSPYPVHSVIQYA